MLQFLTFATVCTKLSVSKPTLFPTTYSANTSAHICPIYLMTVYLKNPVVCCLGLDYVCLPVQYKWLLDLLVLSCPVHRILSLSLYRGLIHRYLSHFVCLLLVRKLMGTPEWLDDRPTYSVPGTQQQQHCQYVYLRAHIKFRSSVNSFRAPFIFATMYPDMSGQVFGGTFVSIPRLLASCSFPVNLYRS